MSLDVYINYKRPKRENYYLNHPYSYSLLSKTDMEAFYEEEGWSANITHNLIPMAQNIPVTFKGEPTTLYKACWHPEDIGAETIADILPMLLQGLHYMIDHRKELEKFNALNGWGTYDSFMKFLLNYKQACEDNDQDCVIETST